MVLRGIAAKLALLFQKNKTVMVQKKGREREREREREDRNHLLLWAYQPTENRTTDAVQCSIWIAGLFIILQRYIWSHSVSHLILLSVASRLLVIKELQSCCLYSMSTLIEHRDVKHVFLSYPAEAVFQTFSFSSTEKSTSAMDVALNYKRSHYFSKTGKRAPTHYALKGLWCCKNPFWPTWSIMHIYITCG